MRVCVCVCVCVCVGVWVWVWPHLINQGLLWCTCQHILVFTLKRKQIASRCVREILSLHTPSCRLTCISMDVEIHHFLSGAIDTPLTELAIPTHAVH